MRPLLHKVATLTTAAIAVSTVCVIASSTASAGDFRPGSNSADDFRPGPNNTGGGASNNSSGSGSQHNQDQLAAEKHKLGKISAVFNEIYDDDFVKNNRDAPYSKFDIIYVAFGHVDRDTHEFGFEKKVGVKVEQKRLNELKRNTASLRAKGRLKLVISQGHGDDAKSESGHLILEEKPHKTADSIAKFVDEQGLDGFDIDYESPLFTSPQAFEKTSKIINKALGPDKLFTITPNTTDELTAQTLNSLYDYVNVQSYAEPGGEQCKNNKLSPVSAFIDLGVKPRKLLAGQDTDPPDPNQIAEGMEPCDIDVAINDYNSLGLKGIFAWQLKPDFDGIATKMWDETRD